MVVGRATRKHAHTLGHIHRSVIFFIFDPQGRVYVSQRADDKEFYPGCSAVTSMPAKARCEGGKRRGRYGIGTRPELEEKMRREKFLPETTILLNYLMSIL